MKFNLIPLKNGLENVAGFNFGGGKCGFKKNGENDLAFIAASEPVDVEAVFTTNRFAAAPIRHFLKTKGTRESFRTNFVLMNSKNANAMTGEAGVRDIEEIFARLGGLENFANFKLVNPLMSSTGVIGYRLDTEAIVKAAAGLDLSARNSDAAVRGIMTTDSFKKELAFKVELLGESGEVEGEFHIAAICKGAGMINPAFATMLCFVLTDANIPQERMKAALNAAAAQSFNAVSVDGDTSTNDTLMLLTSRRGAYCEEAFEFALNTLTKQLALMLVEDGEGSSKVVAFEVSGARDAREAEIAAKALSNSLLVKTALFGEDPNWGRIASTIGASGVECSEEKLRIFYDSVLVYDSLHPQLTPQSEAAAHKVMQKKSYKITCELGVGNGSFTAFGCDLGHKYVEINSDYRS